MKKKSAELDPDTFGDSPDNTKAIPVVGIGASAGGLKPIRDLVKNLPPETGMAFIVLQHITSDAESNLSAILQRETSIPVETIEPNAPIKKNHIFVLPADSLVESKANHFKLIKRSEADSL
jgi:two-component system CheB/CheR fusion protein